MTKREREILVRALVRHAEELEMLYRRGDEGEWAAKEAKEARNMVERLKKRVYGS